MARKRNNTPLNAEQSALAAAFVPLMRATAAHFIKQGWWHEFTDLISEGSMILVMSARGYSTDTGWTFEAYLRESLKNGFWNFIKEERRKGREKWDGVQKISPTYISDNVGPTTTRTTYESTSKKKPTSKKVYQIKQNKGGYTYIDPHTISALEPHYSEENRALFRFDLTTHLRLIRSEIRKRFLLNLMIAMYSSLLSLRSMPYLFELIEEGLLLWEEIESGERPDLVEYLRDALASHNEGNEVCITIKQMQELTRKSYQSILWAITHDKLSGFKVGSKWRVNAKDARVFAQRLAHGKIVLDKEAPIVSTEDNGQPIGLESTGNVSSLSGEV